MVYYKSLALVIGKKTYKEADILITVLSEKYGKIRLLAKGANSHKSTRISSLILGNLVTIDFNKNHDFYYLLDIKTQKAFIKTKKSLNQIKFLFYYLEILNFLITEEESNPQIFNISTQAIAAIENKSLTAFLACLINLLNHLGFGVPPKIRNLFDQKNYQVCFANLNEFIESVAEKPLQTPRSF